MSEHMLHMNKRLFSVRTNVTYENVYVRTYIIHEYEMYSVWTSIRHKHMS